MMQPCLLHLRGISLVARTEALVALVAVGRDHHEVVGLAPQHVVLDLIREPEVIRAVMWLDSLYLLHRLGPTARCAGPDEERSVKQPKRCPCHWIRKGCTISLVVPHSTVT